MSGIDTARAYRITGPVVSFADMEKLRPGSVVPVKFTAEQLAEAKLHDEQVRIREEAAMRYAEQHPDKVYGQVVVDGKLFATVYDSGVAATPHAMKMTEDGFGISLAETRLNEIAKAAKGKIIYSNFFPDAGGSFRGAPESALPPVTARGILDIADEMRWQSERSRIDAMERRAHGEESVLSVLFNGPKTA